MEKLYIFRLAQTKTEIFQFGLSRCTEMKPNASSFLENRIFDQRLVKENLVDKWNLYGDIYKTRSDYRQFLDSYVKFIAFLTIFIYFHETLATILLSSGYLYPAF